MILRKHSALAALGTLTLFACGGTEPTQTPAASEPKAAAPAAAPAAAGTAGVNGKISYEGAPPTVEKVKVSADQKCAAMHKDGLERSPFHVKDGALSDVLVYVKSGVKGSYPAPADPVVLDQKGCDYTPHVLAMRAGQPLKIRNSDDTLHNIHPRPQQNAEFNIGQPRQGMESTKNFEKPEIMIPVGCDVHPWMRAYISVFDHPFYAVTGEDGAFALKGLPAGEYEVEAHHGKLKSQVQKVTVKDGETATLNFTFKG
jgi:hypothetical protein